MGIPRVTCVLLFAGLLSVPDVADAQSGQFRGGGTVFNFNQACRAVGWDRNSEPYTVRYHPNGVGNNGDYESLNFLNNFHAMGHVTYGGRFSRTWRVVEMAGMFAEPFYIPSDGDNPVRVRVTSRNPSAVNANTTGPVRLRGQIRNWGGARNCTVSFDVTVQQQQ